MIRIDIKRSKLYNEITDNKLLLKYFDCKQKQYLHNIDTLYYSVSFLNDKNDNELLLPFFVELDKLKNVLKDTKNKEIITFKNLDVRLGSYAMVYNYRLSEPDLFDVFISDYLPNVNTPRVVVQLRSYGLWLEGEEQLIKKSYDAVVNIFSSYGLKVNRVTENRIDYSYNTNSIQNPYKFFSDKNLDKYLKTTLTKYYKIGDIKNNYFTLDYFSLGQLKSNNIFVRFYNKVKEVIELNYKSFFFDIWYRQGLINEYDKFCFEYAYIKKSYYAIYEARLKFYIQNSNNEFRRNEVIKLLNNDSSRYDDFKILADELTPATTMIMNIEFQTKRKFYYYADSQINNLLTSYTELNNKEKPLIRLFKIINNRNVFLDYLTSNTVFFKSHNFNYLDFWRRLRSLKLDSVHKVNNRYSRNYSNKIDLKKHFSRTLNTIATNSVYRNNLNTSFLEDISDLLAATNDNDLNKFDINLGFYDKLTGEIFDDSNILENIQYNYNEYKRKKYKAIRNRITPQSSEITKK